MCQCFTDTIIRSPRWYIRDLLAPGNMAPGNAGIIFYSDILLPFVGFALLWFKRSTGSACRASGVASHPVRG